MKPYNTYTRMHKILAAYLAPSVVAIEVLGGTFHLNPEDVPPDLREDNCREFNLIHTHVWGNDKCTDKVVIKRE